MPGMRRLMLAPAPVCLIWAGVVLGVDLVGAPAPFSVGGLERPLALAVNRAAFETLKHLEWALAAVSLVLVAWTRPGRVVALGLALALGALALQSLWLLPELSARTDLVLAGRELPPSPVHALYGVAELIKVLSLLVAGLAGLSPVSRTV